LGFTDRGNRLTTPSENTEVVRSLVRIAQARGWHEITVRGTERFRQEAWFAATVAGLEVRGYRPSEVEQGRLVRTVAREKTGDAPTLSPGRDADSMAGTAVGEPPPWPGIRATPAVREALLVGKLLDHGRATYHHDPRAAMSYFVKLKVAGGERVVWGVDLERANKESLTKPQIGDEVGLRSLLRDAVKVKVPTRGDAGQVTGEVERVRNRWIVEKREFFEVRAAAARKVQDPAVKASQAVRQYPELAASSRSFAQRLPAPWPAVSRCRRFACAIVRRPARPSRVNANPSPLAAEQVL
jgi:putative DNA primase/helicase